MPQGLGLYLRRHSYSNTRGPDLFSALEASARSEGVWPQDGVGEQLGEVMATWTHQVRQHLPGPQLFREEIRPL